MKSFSELKHGERVKNVKDGTVLKAVVWRDEMFLAGERDMWPTEEFDPKDWTMLKGEQNG